VARSLVAQATCRCPERRDNPPAREGISGRRTRLIFTEGAGSDLGNQGSIARAKARRRWPWSDRDARGTARSERSERQHRAPTRSSPPKRIERRETPDSPAPWPREQARESRARREPRRDAGNSRARVLVIEAVGSRSRSYLSFDRPPGGAARQTGGGRASSKVAIVSH